MLELLIPGEQGFDDESQRFITTKPEVEVKLKHSLVSVSKWESEFQIAFLGKAEKTNEQILKYVEHMLVEPLETPSDLDRLSKTHYEQIRDYITDAHSATRLMQLPGNDSAREVVTSELIYYWMIALNIPWEAQHWHLSRLMTLIDLTQRKQNSGSQKMNKSDMARQRAKMNQARRGGRPG